MPHICRFRGKCGIVYAHSRKEVEATALHLKKAGISCDFYHASRRFGSCFLFVCTRSGSTERLSFDVHHFLFVLPHDFSFMLMTCRFYVIMVIVLIPRSLLASHVISTAHRGGWEIGFYSYVLGVIAGPSFVEQSAYIFLKMMFKYIWQSSL